VARLAIIKSIVYSW